MTPTRENLREIILFPDNYPKTWISIRSVITSIPMFFLAFLEYNFGDMNHEVQDKIKGFLGYEITLIMLLIAPMLISFLFDIWKWGAEYLIERSSKYNMTPQARELVLSALHRVVGIKSKRFGEFAKTLDKDETASKDSFNEITQPEKQIQELLTQLSGVIAKLEKYYHFHIILTEIKNHRPHRYIAFSGEHRVPNDEHLTQKSFIGWIAKHKQFEHIDDIATYLKNRKKASPQTRRKKFKVNYRSSIQSNNVGSICGFPIINNYLGKVSYVLTIKSDEPSRITKNFEQKHRGTLDEFFSRILLENSLQHIKNFENEK